MFFKDKASEQLSEQLSERYRNSVRTLSEGGRTWSQQECCRTLSEHCRNAVVTLSESTVVLSYRGRWGMVPPIPINREAPCAIANAMAAKHQRIAAPTRRPRDCATSAPHGTLIRAHVEPRRNALTTTAAGHSSLAVAEDARESSASVEIRLRYRSRSVCAYKCERRLCRTAYRCASSRSEAAIRSGERH